MDFSFLEVGQAIEIDIPIYEKGGAVTELYYSHVMDYDLDEDGGIWVAVPQRQGKGVEELRRNEKVFVKISLADAIYSFECFTMGWDQEPEALIISLPHDIKRVQRRNFVREDAQLFVNLIYKDEKLTEPFLMPSITTDISGGGMMVDSAYEIPLYTTLDVKLEIPPEDDEENPTILPFQGVVRRTFPNKENSKRFLIGLSFNNIAEGVRDQIIRYIFRYQREQRQRKIHLNE